jgi:hypothetical protein
LVRLQDVDIVELKYGEMNSSVGCLRMMAPPEKNEEQKGDD